jgi:hypothetical protein
MSDAHGPKSILPGMGLMQSILGTVSKNGIHIGEKQFMIVFAIIIAAFFIIEPEQSVYNFEMVVYLAPLWIPFILYRPAQERFAQAQRVKFLHGQKYILLEVKMPRETTKTPLAMETFFSNIHIGSGEATAYKRRQGSVRPWWSFEIVSLGGRIHFYIWTRESFRRLIESSLYAQYPDIEIIEAEDYSRKRDPAEHHNTMWGCEYTKTKPDPYPIKTYIEYGLTPGNKPEENVDPLGQMLELMGSLAPGEELWFQMIIRMTKNEKLTHKKTASGSPYTWQDEAVDLIDDLRLKNSLKGQYIDPITGEAKETKVGQLTKGQGDIINAIESNIMKQGFDVGMRAIYSAPEDKFQGHMIGSVISMFKPFNNESKNTIGLQGVWSAIFNDFPWEDPTGHHKHVLNEGITQAYRQRAYFHLPYKGAWSVMSTEELATLYHVPNSGVTTPNLERIQSATSGAPANLPQ